jgi:hypothetical protein
MKLLVSFCEYTVLSFYSRFLKISNLVEGSNIELAYAVYMVDILISTYKSERDLYNLVRAQNIYLEITVLPLQSIFFFLF